MSAKELFEDLGYKEYKSDERLYWSEPNEYELGGHEPYVVFDLIYQEWHSNIVDIEKKKDLIQAINKQIEELGWDK